MQSGRAICNDGSNKPVLGKNSVLAVFCTNWICCRRSMIERALEMEL